MGIHWLDWFGYGASVIILISLMMRSITKLRWINLAGAIMFAGFGFMIGSVPTGALNLGIACINVYFLWTIYRAREEMVMVEAEFDSPYFRHFWNTNQAEIVKIFGDVALSPEKRAFYFLRNNNTAGVLIGHESERETFCIDIDFVIRAYRDLKLGLYFISSGRIAAVIPRMKRLQTTAAVGIHERYLRKLGFSEIDGTPGLFEKMI